MKSLYSDLVKITMVKSYFGGKLIREVLYIYCNLCHQSYDKKFEKQLENSEVRKFQIRSVFQKFLFTFSDCWQSILKIECCKYQKHGRKTKQNKIP